MIRPLLALLVMSAPAMAACDGSSCTLEAQLPDAWSHCRASDALGYDAEGRPTCVAMPSSDPDVLMVWRTMGGMSAIRTTDLACKAALKIAKDGLWCIPERAP